MQFTVKCPHCGARLKGVKSLMGTVVECGNCVKEFRVPTFELPGSAPKSKAKERSTPSDTGSNTLGDRLREMIGESRSPWLIPGAAMAGAVFTIGCLIWWIGSSDPASPDGAQVTLAELIDDQDTTEPPTSNDSDSVATPSTAKADSPEESTGETDPSSEATAKEEPVVEVATVDDKPPVSRNPGEMLEFLKSATVFIKVSTTEGMQSGSGFLVQREGDNGFIVSNSHVIEPREGTLKSIECVFRSGRPDEYKVLATVAGRDKSRDLAILKLVHEKLPEPIGESSDVDVHETLSVLVLGFPFGEVLTTSKRSPAITVTRCAISSMRRDDYDNVSLLQVDGGINPGNSGGPVVTEDGNLVGVAVAKLIGTEIGFAIPRRHLGSALAGRISAIEVKEITKDSKKRIYNARPTIIDPRQNIASVEMLTFSASEMTEKRPEVDGSWKQVAKKPASTLLDVDNGSLVIVPVKLNAWAWQVKWTLKNGTAKYSEPIKYGSKAAKEMASGSTQQPRPSKPDQPKINHPLPDSKKPPQDSQTSEEADNIEVVQLASPMADFAINPTTGDIATVDPTAHRARLFRAAEGLATGTEAANVLVAPNRFMTLKGADARLDSGSLLRRIPTENPVSTNCRTSSRGGESIVAGPVVVRDRGVSRSLEESRTPTGSSGSKRSSLNRHRVTLNCSRLTWTALLTGCRSIENFSVDIFVDVDCGLGRPLILRRSTLTTLLSIPAGCCQHER